MGIISLSVRTLVEFILRSGSIDSRFTGFDRANEGAMIHRKIQSMQGDSYDSEVSLSICETYNGIDYEISGRADGIFERNGEIFIDEIKSVDIDLSKITEDYNKVHWAQAMCYGYIFLEESEYEDINIQLTYVNDSDEQIKRFVRHYEHEELREFFFYLLARYDKWAKIQLSWVNTRNESLKMLQFPFKEYRKGQKELAKYVFRAIMDKRMLICEAPTGIGKTMSTMFPALKAMGEGVGDKLFYLTAKTITRKAAQDAIELLHNTYSGDLQLKSITITAKEKICFMCNEGKERKCTPEDCKYADGYYDKLSDVLFIIISTERFMAREDIERYAREYEVCPFELSLDISDWFDVIVCDYNYFFDPTAHLRRFFEYTSDHTVLVDEVHNLVSRSREMYSSSLEIKKIKEVKKDVPKRQKKIISSLNSLIEALEEICNLADYDKPYVQKGIMTSIYDPVNKCCEAIRYGLDKYKDDVTSDMLALYFDLKFFMKIYELYDDNYINLITKNRFELCCLDASKYIRESMDDVRSVILFSATLEPISYYADVLGTPDAGRLRLLSPFDRNRLGLFVANKISTRYRDRENTLEAVCNLIGTMVQAKQGNYIAFFPSYKYMENAVDLFSQLYENINIVVQKNDMNETAREEFLKLFDNDKDETMLGFCVMGGVFSEGIDLTGDKLIGTAIVGTGHPQINEQLNALREYFDEKNDERLGYKFAYTYPGMNKVMQAAGRVIRTESDKGVVLLIDDRFTTREYLELFPEHWKGYKKVINSVQLSNMLNEFWEN